jgi:branched-chain amino acid aminotransferase
MKGTAHRERFVYVSSKFVSESDARVSVFDRGFLYGDGIFETMRAYNGNIFRLAQHIQRLRQSAEYIGLRIEWTAEHIADVCTQLLKKNRLLDAIVRVSVTRGNSIGGIGITQAAEPTIVAFARPPMPLPADAYGNGISARFVAVRRTPSAALDARVKSMNYLNLIMARAEAEKNGSHEAILLNQRGSIAETSTGNIFFSNGDRLVTPGLDCDILPGITRATVFELAAALDVGITEKEIDVSEVTEYRECFITNSAVELLPVTKIDNRVVGDGKPGPMYRQLHEAYRDLVGKR